MRDLFGEQKPSLIINDGRFDMWTASGWCNHETDTIEIVAIVASNGAFQYRPRCLDCGHIGSQSLPHDRLNDAERRAVVVLRDNRGQTPCARCGSLKGVEEHHWAPRARFADCDSWPTSPLCVDCHVIWHQVMNVED